MGRPMPRRVGLPALAAVLTLLAFLITAGNASAQGGPAVWRLEQPAPPPGVPFKVPLGEPGDLSFFAPNRGLLTVNGNDTIPRGIFSWDGRSWHQLATVCGGPGDTARIAWAGPTEFWVVSVPSPPRAGSGLALCRFKDGQVVASYSTRVDSPDPFRQMNSAACNGPDDCWFGGVGSQDGLGERVGAFHLHWDGESLQSFYGPQGRGVTDIEVHEGAFFESTLVGRSPENRDDPVQLAQPESPPRLLHRIDPGPLFTNDPFVPAPLPDVPADGSELLALDSDGTNLWAVGGGAASGPSAPANGSVPRRPLIARRVGGGFAEITPNVVTPNVAFAPDTRFGDVAAIPSTDAAWVTAVPFSERRSTNAKATIARVDSNGTTSIVRLPAAGAGRGSAARIACPATNECWMVTRAGWLFHLSDGTVYPQDTDPAFQGTIEFRPNESAEQLVPDMPPPDDSKTFQPLPLEPAPKQPKPTKLLKRVKSKLEGKRLVVSFFVARPARIQLIARKKKRVVAKSPLKRFSPGRGELSVRVTRERYPDELEFKIRELGEE